MKTYLLPALLFALSCLPLSAQEVASNEHKDKSNNAEIEAFIQDFHRKLNSIANAYEGNFGSIKGQERDSRMSVEYNSRVALPEALDNYLSKESFGQRFTFVATFAETKDKGEAENIYNSLVWLVGNCKFDIGGLVSNELDDPDGVFLRHTYWLPFGPEDAFDDFVIHVKLIKSMDISDDFEISDEYLVVINITHI